MADVLKAEISQIIRNELSGFHNEFRAVRDAVQRIDQRTYDLDETQREVKELYRQLQQVVSRLEAVLQQVKSGDVNAPTRTQDARDTKLRVQNIEQGVAAIVQYLQENQNSSKDTDPLSISRNSRG